MYTIPAKVIELVKRQAFLVVSTLDAKGGIHCSIKGFAYFSPDGKLCVADLYNGRTAANLRQSPTISVTAIDEHAFSGYTIQGQARLIEFDKIKPDIFKQWQEHIVGRISRRVIRHIHAERSSVAHPESRLPQPKFLIEIEVENIIDLTPERLKRSR